MELIRLKPPRVNGQVVSFAWRCDPPTALYKSSEFELRFPASVDVSRVPEAIWWRVVLLCLHGQWPLLRPCRVVLPVRLEAGEREFWLRMCDAAVATLEGWSGGNDLSRRIELVESGPALERPEPVRESSLAVACFSGGRDSLAQTALLGELGITPLLVTICSPREGSHEHETERRRHVMSEIQSRRGLELIEVSSTLRGRWNLGFAAPRYQIGVSELADTFLYCAAALAVAVARGASAVYLASEAELQQSAKFGGQIVQYKHFMMSGATQRSLSALLERFGIRYSGATYPLFQFQLQRLLGKRYRDLRDLQYSCWSMDADEGACGRCDECLHNAFNLMSDGISPEEIGIDVVRVLSAAADWRPRVDEARVELPNLYWLFDMQLLRCLAALTPERAARFISPTLRGTTAASQALAAYERMRSSALELGVEPEPGYRAGYLRLLDPRLRTGLAAIFDEHFEREDEALHAGHVERSLAVTDWVSAPLTRPSVGSRSVGNGRPPSGVRAAPPEPAARDAAELAELGPSLPDPEPALAGGNGSVPLWVALPVLDGNERRYVNECVETSWISSAGGFIGRFERAFAEASGCRFAVACSSGTTALHLALAAAGIGPGDEVILPTFTMIACGNAVGYVGATPVLVDTDPRTWNLDLDLVRDRIGPRTRAIMIVHTYGHPVDADAVGALAEQNGLVVIEDAAEAHGAELRGRPAGSLGTVGTFSFYGNKIVTTGEGGMVTTNDEAIATVARELRDHAFSSERHFWHRFKGFNFRMSNLQAAVGLAQVERLDCLLEQRREMGRLYREALAGIPGLELPPTEPGFLDSNWMFGCTVNGDFGVTRDELRRRLAADGIETRTFFVPIHIQPSYCEAFRGRRFPVAERLGATGLYLPSGPAIGEPQVARVAAAVARARGE